MLRKLTLGIVSALALTAAANAADIYPAPGGYKDGYAPVPTWAGWYAGVNGGYGWSATGDQLSYPHLFAGVDPKGGFAGGQIGYNWQGILHPHLVVGIEADLQSSDIGASRNWSGTTLSSELEYFGTIRGRLGLAFDRSLFYATGGFAYGKVKNDFGVGGFSILKFNDTATGYTIGGGWEHKIAPAWSVKAEYQYIDLGKNNPSVSGFTWTQFGGHLADDAFHTVRVGLNYHFGSSVYEPLK